MSLSSFISGVSRESPVGGRYAAAVIVVGNSWLFGTLERCIELIAIAWGRSAVGVIVAAVFRDSEIIPAQRLRLIGCAVLSASVVHCLLVGVGELLKPPMGGLMWCAAIPLSLVCIGLPRQCLEAWKKSRAFGSGRGSVS
jgi:hypothetical protein